MFWQRISPPLGLDKAIEGIAPSIADLF